MLQDLLAVWFPKCCWGFGLNLPKKQQWLCVYCQVQLPKTYFEEDNNNSLKVMMRLHLPLESAYAPFYFAQKPHSTPLTYAQISRQTQNRRLDDQTVFCIASQQHLIKQCNAVVPVPLHPKQEKQRGYNQNTRFRKYWASLLGVPFLDNLLFRKNETKTLVRMNRKQRW